MIEKIIEYSVRNRILIVLLTAVLTAIGVWATYNIRLDAIPDLSDVQVIVVTEYPGQNPQVVDDQVTYPLASAMLAVPGSTDVRGFSMFELSFVYVLFEDGTDIYWARSRVLEYLNFARDRLPVGVEPKLGPDATGVGWVYQYILYPGWYCDKHPQGLWHDPVEDRWYESQAASSEAVHQRLVHVRAFEQPGSCPLDGTPLVSANQDLAQLRSLQDWYLRYPLTAVDGVAEVAPIGGFVRQYQVVLDPRALQAFQLPLGDVVDAIRRSNNDVGGSVVELAEHEYMVRSRGYLRGLDDLAKVVVRVGENGTPILLSEVAKLEIGGEMRRGVGDYNGTGEAVGGVVISRFGENAYKVIRDAKAKLAELEGGLPPGVMIKTTYDRSALIERAVDTLREAVAEELIVVALICIVFLAHLPSAFVAVFILPVGLVVSMLVMRELGINANIMSLGGLALAIGVMVDSGVVMIENAHKHLERERESVAGGAPPRPHAEIILEAAQEVGPTLFFSLLVITVAFLPIFVLGDQSGRLFKPLAYTKTFAIFAGALLGITIVPVMMVYFIRGRIPHEERNPINRVSMALYEPFFHAVLRHPFLTLLVTVLLGLSAVYPYSRLGEEFMPALEEGDLLYMPTTDPSISITKSKRAPAADRQADQDVSRGGERARQDRPRRHRDRSGAAVDDRDRRAAGHRRGALAHAAGGILLPQLAGLAQVAADAHVLARDRAASRWTSSSTAGPIPTARATAASTTPSAFPASPTPGRTRSRTASTCSPPASRRRSASRSSDPTCRSSATSPSARRARCARSRERSAPIPSAPSAATTSTSTSTAMPPARYGLTTGDVQDVIQTAVGGMNVTTTVEGLERYPLNVRYARELRDDIPALREVLVAAPNGAQVPLGQLADIRITSGPPMIRSENAQRTRLDLRRHRRTRPRRLRRRGQAASPTRARRCRPATRASGRAASSISRRPTRGSRVVIPITLVLIVFLLYVANQSWFRVRIVLLAVPFSLIGAFWFLWALGYNMSLAVWVGIIALLGVDAETGQVMLLYLDNAFDRFKAEGRMRDARRPLRRHSRRRGEAHPSQDDDRRDRHDRPAAAPLGDRHRRRRHPPTRRPADRRHQRQLPHGAARLSGDLLSLPTTRDRPSRFGKPRKRRMSMARHPRVAILTLAKALPPMRGATLPVRIATKHRNAAGVAH